MDTVPLTGQLAMDTDTRVTGIPTLAVLVTVQDHCMGAMA